MAHATVDERLLPVRTSSKIGLTSQASHADPAPYSSHRHQRDGEAPAVGRGVAKQSPERVHSLNRYRSSTQRATTPSRQVIFLPSS